MNIINNEKEIERREKTMYQKKLNIWASLLIAILLLAACGGGGSSGSGISSTSTTNDGKTASATISFAFPPEEEVGAAVISDATTNILVNVKQWTTDDLNNLRVVNTDKALLTKANPSTTIDLFPTYTRICASQYKGDPNDYRTSQILETACTFGKLNPGSNTVTLTMIRGEWTLTSPFNGVESVALTRGGLNPSSSYYQGCYPDVGTDVLDGNPIGAEGPFDVPAQALNNWGSIYQAMFKKNGAYQFLENSGAWYTNFL
jgi:hypothetical protein